jgi:hypothetical protein
MSAEAIKVFVTTGGVTRGSQHAVTVVTWYRMPDLAGHCLFGIFVGCCVLELVAVPWLDFPATELLILFVVEVYCIISSKDGET